MLPGVALPVGAFNVTVTGADGALLILMVTIFSTYGKQSLGVAFAVNASASLTVVELLTNWTVGRLQE